MSAFWPRVPPCLPEVRETTGSSAFGQDKQHQLCASFVEGRRPVHVGYTLHYMALRPTYGPFGMHDAAINGRLLKPLDSGIATVRVSATLLPHTPPSPYSPPQTLPASFSHPCSWDCS